MSSKIVAVIAGVGPGIGASVARRFAKAYPVALLARSENSYQPLVDEINKSGGQAIGISTDVSDSKSVKAAFDKIKSEFGSDVGLAAAVFNASGSFARKSFLELTEEEFDGSVKVSLHGAFLFSQSALSLLLAGVKQSPSLPPTLIFTGATASIKANAMMGSFAASKFASRALSSSLAKEFGPQGIHVSHAIIDGVVDTERAKAYMADAGPDAKMAPDAIAESYWALHEQPRSSWSWEIDLRPWVEKF